MELFFFNQKIVHGYFFSREENQKLSAELQKYRAVESLSKEEPQEEDESLKAEQVEWIYPLLFNTGGHKFQCLWLHSFVLMYLTTVCS